MGFAHHCVYLSYHCPMILEIRQYPKVSVTFEIADYAPAEGLIVGWCAADLSTMLGRLDSSDAVSLVSNFITVHQTLCPILDTNN